MCYSMEGWKSVQTTQQPIKLPSSVVKDLSKGERPPPKPPPPNHFSVTTPTTPYLSLIRPPLKPSWFYCGLVSLTFSCFSSIVVMFDVSLCVVLLLCFSIYVHVYVLLWLHKLFVKMPQWRLTFWTRVMCVNLKVVANNLYLLNSKCSMRKFTFHTFL